MEAIRDKAGPQLIDGELGPYHVVLSVDHFCAAIYQV